MAETEIEIKIWKPTHLPDAPIQNNNIGHRFLSAIKESNELEHYCDAFRHDVLGDTIVKCGSVTRLGKISAIGEIT
jgi:hypothetical protein